MFRSMNLQICGKANTLEKCSMPNFGINFKMRTVIGVRMDPQLWGFRQQLKKGPSNTQAGQ